MSSIQYWLHSELLNGAISMLTCGAVFSIDTSRELLKSKILELCKLLPIDRLPLMIVTTIWIMHISQSAYVSNQFQNIMGKICLHSNSSLQALERVVIK